MMESNRRISVTLPTELLRQIDRAVREGYARSRNKFVTNALRRALAELERAAIDAAFAGMAEDADYQAEAQDIASAFDRASWEAIQYGKR